MRLFFLIIIIVICHIFYISIQQKDQEDTDSDWSNIWGKSIILHKVVVNQIPRSSSDKDRSKH